MVSIKNSNQIEQFKLSDKYTIFRTKYNGGYLKEDFLKRTFQNESLYFYKSYKTENSLDIKLECDEFNSINSQVLDFLKEELQCNTDKVAKSSWVYIQSPEFKMHWMHTHEYLESTNRTNLRTQWTFVFYIQIPPNLKKGEGDIIFETEDKKRHTFVPNENDILIFPGHLPHIAMPTQSGKIDRIVYAANLNFDFSSRNSEKKKVKFEELY